MYFVKYRALFVKEDLYQYSIYPTRDMAYFSFTHSPYAVSFGSVDEEFSFYLNVIERKEVSDVKQEEN